MPSPKTIDYDQLHKIADLDEDGSSLKKFIEIFSRTAPEKLAQFKVAAKKKDADQVSKIAHNLRTTCAYVGAVKMVKICLELESSDDKVDFKHVGKLLDTLDDEFEKADTELNDYVKNPSKKK